MPNREPDEILMLRVAQGDHAACGQLAERHLERILAFASRTLGNRAAAEDVAQEVITRVWTHAKRWRPGPARLTSWLHRIALNLCLDHLARQRRESLHEGLEPADPIRDTARRVRERDLQDRVRAGLRSLPDMQRAAITLCYYQGFRNVEAAEILGVSVDALESLLARARRTLRGRWRAVAPELLDE